MFVKTQAAALLLSVFATVAAHAEAPDRKTADCIDREMDRMFDAGQLKDLNNPPRQDYYSYKLEGQAYKDLVTACERETGQKTLYPQTTGQTSHRIKPEYLEMLNRQRAPGPR